MPVEVVLLFDFGGVLTSVAAPAARRLAQFHMQLVFERASRSVSLAVGGGDGGGAAQTSIDPQTLASRYSSMYFLVSVFTERVQGLPSAWKRLENGLIRRNEFIATFHRELAVFLRAMSTPIDDAAALAALQVQAPSELLRLQKRYPHLSIPLVQKMVVETLDAESFLCVLEKLSLRKNVLNMLHYLRAKTFQEIKLGVITNNWESEGHYVRTSTAVSHSGSPQFINISCPIEYAEEGGSFDVNGLFDVVAQSYMLGKSKPGPDIYEIAVESVLGKQRVRNAASESPDGKPMIFFFDDLKLNCDAAMAVPSKPFHTVYHITSGPADVYKFVHDAIKKVAKRDPETWTRVLIGLETDIAPLFVPKVVPPPSAVLLPAAGTPLPSAPTAQEGAKNNAAASSPVAPEAGSTASGHHHNHHQGGARKVAKLYDAKLSWVQIEFNNIDDNLLFPPPPPNTSLEPLDTVTGPNYMDLEERNRILHFLARTAPQYFVFPTVAARFEDAGNLCEDGGFATSSGRIFFEVFRGGMSNPTYRFTCRTGSFVVRKQPRGRLLPGAHNMKREFDIVQHLAATSTVPVPKCVAFCNDRNVCEQDFYVMRYRDGRMVYRLGELAAPPFSRPFSQSRVLSKTTLNPRLFFREAVATLVQLHQAPIPQFLNKKKKPDDTGSVRGDPSATALHPIDHLVSVWERQYRRVLSAVPSGAPPDTAAKVRFRSFEYLTEALHMAFTHASEVGVIPRPERMCLTHGDFKIDNIMFTHRSLEGRTKYPPKIVLLLDFELANVGDPLTDVAYLALFHLFPSPRGILDLPRDVRARYPSAEDILEEYCTKARYMSLVPAANRKRIFNVYMAAMCQKLAGIAHGVYARGLLGNATDTPQALKLAAAVDHLSRAGCTLLGLEAPGEGSKL